MIGLPDPLYNRKPLPWDMIDNTSTKKKPTVAKRKKKSRRIKQASRRGNR